MGTPHKHAAIIKAWADGAKIECSTDSGITWKYIDSPNWYLETLYRIKPKPPVKKYHFAFQLKRDGVPKISQFWFDSEESFIRCTFGNELGTPPFDWISKIQESEKEFPAI